MRGVKFAWSASHFAPCLNELTVLGEFHDTCVACATMPVGHEDIAIGSDYHIRGLVESIRAIASDSCLAQDQQDLALGTELDHLLSLAVFSLSISDPHVPFPIHENAMRENKHACAKTLQ